MLYIVFSYQTFVAGREGLTEIRATASWSVVRQGVEVVLVVVAIVVVAVVITIEVVAIIQLITVAVVIALTA